MEVKIGVLHAPRELVVETSDSAEDVEAALAAALADDNGAFILTDTRGRRVVVPARGVAYLEIGTGVSGTVGFRG
jgi:Protein of unknown function (DUF3107)